MNGSLSAAPQPVSVVEFGWRRAIIVIGIMSAALLQTLDATIVNVALPTIEGNIGASIDDGTWIVTGYIISNVIAIPLSPFLQRRLGRRVYFATCIIGFTAASFLCGTATSLESIVAYRVIQGAFGGGLIATSQVLLRETFRPDEIGASSALFAIALTIGPALGPTVGGILTDQFSWPWVFDINIVPGMIAAFIVFTMLRDPLPPQRIPFDVAGVALLATGLGCLQFVLDEGERNDWFSDGHIVWAFAGAIVALSVFVYWELRGAAMPVVDLRVFRYTNLRAGAPAALLLGTVVFGPVVLLPQYVQNVLGFTATLSGLLILARAIPVVIFTPFVARLAGRYDPRLILTTGFVISASSFALLFTRMTPHSDFDSFVWLLVLSGIGQSMLLVPLLMLILGDVPPVDAAKGSAIVSLSVQLGGSIISTLLITAVDRRTSFHSDILRAHATRSALPFARFIGSSHAALGQAAHEIALQATNMGFADALALLMPISLVTLLPVWLLRRKRGAAPAVVAAE